MLCYVIRGWQQQAEFEKKRKKAAGVSAGYIAKDELGNTFILKHFYKTHAACMPKNTR